MNHCKDHKFVSATHWEHYLHQKIFNFVQAELLFFKPKETLLRNLQMLIKFFGSERIFNKTTLPYITFQRQQVD